MNSNIFEALDAQFKTNRIIFWYDGEEQQREYFENYENPEIKKMEIKNNEFHIKYIINSSASSTKFLIYSARPRPEDKDNWLLDLNKQHFIFATNQAAGIIRELEIDLSLEELVNIHLDLFKNRTERLEPLKTIITTLPQPVGEKDFLAAMISVLCGSVKTEKERLKSIEEICIILLHDLSEETPKQYLKQIEKFKLDNFLWKEIKKKFYYTDGNCEIESFTAFLFKKAFDYEVNNLTENENRQAYIFLDKFRNLYNELQAYDKISRDFSNKLNISSLLSDKKLEQLIEWDLFLVYDKLIVGKIINDFKDNLLSVKAGLAYIETRKTSYWLKVDNNNRLKNTYNCFEMFFKLIITVDSLRDLPSSTEELWKLYTTKIFRIDYYYRKFLEAYENTYQSYYSYLLDYAEKEYVNRYMTMFTNKWQDTLKVHDLFGDSFILQRDFFKRYVKPYISQRKNIFVICCDALRFEIGHELAACLEKNRGIKVDVDPMLASIPTYTQTGMASLLPNKRLEINPAGSQVIIDGKNSAGFENRGKILENYFKNNNPEIKAKAFKIKDFLNLDTQNQKQEIDGFHCIYLYSNEIDCIGDSVKTESNLAKAVMEEIKQLIKTVKTIINLNRTHIVITSDHGFLYQYKPIDETGFLEVEADPNEIKRDRRFIIGKNLKRDNRFNYFKSNELGLLGDFDIKIPKGTSRLRKQGAGSRYVHGGISIQELCIPVLKIKKTREDDIKIVSFAVLSSNEAITTNQLSIKLFQQEPVSLKIHSLIIILRFEGENGEILSNQQRVIFDSEDPHEQNRTQTTQFVFSKSMDKYNNRTIKLCFYEEKYGQLIKLREPIVYRIRISLTHDFY